MSRPGGTFAEANRVSSLCEYRGAFSSDRLTKLELIADGDDACEKCVGLTEVFGIVSRRHAHADIPIAGVGVEARDDGVEPVGRGGEIDAGE